MSKSNNPKETEMIWTRSTDKYGRSVHHLRNEQMRTLGVVVKLPKLASAPGHTHFTNANGWSGPYVEGYEVQYFGSLKAAKSALEVEVASR